MLIITLLLIKKEKGDIRIAGCSLEIRNNQYIHHANHHIDLMCSLSPTRARTILDTKSAKRSQCAQAVQLFFLYHHQLFHCLCDQRDTPKVISTESYFHPHAQVPSRFKVYDHFIILITKIMVVVVCVCVNCI